MTTTSETLPALRLPTLALIDEERKELLRRTICRGADDLELDLFTATCSRTGLDPFLNQCHFVKRWDASERREVGKFSPSIDGLRLIADRSGDYAPGRPTTYTYDTAGNLASATSYVKKYVRGEWHEISETAYLEEYQQRTKDGAPNRMWATMPRVMLAKVAEARALRRAFPAEMSGLYAPEEMREMPSATVIDTPRGRVATATGEIVEERRALPPAAQKRPKLHAAWGEMTVAACTHDIPVMPFPEEKTTDAIKAEMESVWKLIRAAEEQSAADAGNATLDREMDVAAAEDPYGDPFMEPK